MAYKSKRGKAKRGSGSRSTKRVQRANRRTKSVGGGASRARGGNSRPQTVRIVVEHRQPGTVGAGTPTNFIGMKPAPKPRTRPQF